MNHILSSCSPCSWTRRRMTANGLQLPRSHPSRKDRSAQAQSKRSREGFEFGLNGRGRSRALCFETWSNVEDGDTAKPVGAVGFRPVVCERPVRVEPEQQQSGGEEEGEERSGGPVCSEHKVLLQR